MIRELVTWHKTVSKTAENAPHIFLTPMRRLRMPEFAKLVPSYYGTQVLKKPEQTQASGKFFPRRIACLLIVCLLISYLASTHGEVMFQVTTCRRHVLVGPQRVLKACLTRKLHEWHCFKLHQRALGLRCSGLGVVIVGASVGSRVGWVLQHWGTRKQEP